MMQAKIPCRLALGLVLVAGCDGDPSGSPTTDPYGLTWVNVPAATFQMGCPASASHCEADEQPVHPVTLSAFTMTRTEITQAQYQAVMGSNPSFFQPAPTDCTECTAYPACPDCPVENVNWEEARAFCAAVGGRLPTEAEWEHAARGGTATAYSCGDDPACLEGVAWFAGNAQQRPHPVGQKAANPFGLHDMHGNVWEWVEDCYRPSHTDAPGDGSARQGAGCTEDRVLRGGGWIFGPPAVTSSSRTFYSAGFRDGMAGFRCVRG